MEPAPIFLAAQSLLFEVERRYASLLLCARPSSFQDQEPTLGGKLLYAAELDQEGRASLVAGNIAGAASLAATADPAAQKQAIRDGAADFLVTNLDEALRILKNEIRKRQPVAVCVALAPQAVEREMLERGVRPDLLRRVDDLAAHAPFLRQGARLLDPAPIGENQTLLTWRVAVRPAQWLPKLDALALACLAPTDVAARRWLRLAPRYLGRQAQGVRLLRCDRAIAANFQALVQEQIDRGEIPVAVNFHPGSGS